MHGKGNIPPLLQDLIYAKEHGLLDRDFEQTGSLLVQYGIADGFPAEEIQNSVQRHVTAQELLSPYEFPMLPHGNLVLGIDLQGNLSRIPLTYLNGHSLTIAGTGSGKTTKSRFLILQIAYTVRGLWGFDFVKRELSILKPYLARLGIELLVVPARAIRLNPLQCPERVAPADWAPRIADVLVQTLQLPSRATKLLHTTILELYRLFGVFDGSKNYPTLFDLREAVATDTNANYQAKQAIVDALDPTLMSIGNVFAFREGWKTKDLTKRRIVFELGGISETDKNLLLNSLILSEFTSRVAQGISNSPMDHWLCLDEAQRILSTTNQTGSIANLIGLVRGTGIGLDLSVQTSDVSNAILSNTANKFIGRCGSAADYAVMAGAMGLTREQRQWLNTNLNPGMFVGQIGEGNWRKPFVFRIPPMRLKRNPDEQTYDLGDLHTLPTVAAEEFVNWRPRKGNAQQQSSETSQKRSGLSAAELRYLRVVVDNSDKPSSAFPKLARMSPKRALEIRRRLVDLGYLREHRVTKGRGRPTLVFEPLQKAIDALRDEERNAGA